MKISIIIPTFNEEEYLPVLLESIKNQTYQDYEIIVADAESDDKTVEIAKKYNCKIVEGGLPGVGRNNGAKIAEGELLLFLDSDLKLPKNYLIKVVHEFTSENIGIGITQMEPLSKKTEDIILHNLANWFMIATEKIKPHGAGCYGIIAKKSLHEKCDGFDETLNFGEDTDYIERLAKKERFKVLRGPKIGVSTRRLEEEGLYTLLRQYGKSTYNDFKGIRTDADEIDYGFGHGPLIPLDKEEMEIIAEKSNELNNFEKISKAAKDSTDVLIKNSIKSFTKKSSKKNSKKVVFYSICGEGMGHAIRSGVIIDKLKNKYDIHIFSSDRAYKYLKNKFENVYEIGGFNTVYENNKVSDSKTLFKAMKANPTNLKEGYDILYKQSRKYKPNIIISDFENYSSVLSKLINVPLISLDNIHMITQTKIDYPYHHQTDMLKAKGVIKAYILRPKIHILTSFFYPKVRKGKKAIIYPPVLRDEILKLEPKIGDHILVYQTSDSSIKLVEKLKNVNEKFIIYGFNKEETQGNLVFKKFNEDVFFKDISEAKAVICNGGFTLISEAIYLKKPIYSVPAHGNFEQILNGFYVDKLGYGEYHSKIKTNQINKFLSKLDKYQKKLNSVKKTDNEGIIKELEYNIEKYSKK
ncbi:glycosyltransferase [Methanobrevibacter sp. OttesenSCG-928-K11]|nr:glycosyltransferase [Methanobrevibacter sp. OttesenSCG-928-K11]MDL2271195.1 glycosyltransferase [Methanobrevibacter sp. OttesenSCG-928-I08]